MTRFVSYFEKYSARRAEERTRLEAEGLKSEVIDKMIRENVYLNPVTDPGPRGQTTLHSDLGAHVEPEGPSWTDVEPELAEKYGLSQVSPE